MNQMNDLMLPLAYLLIKGGKKESFWFDKGDAYDMDLSKGYEWAELYTEDQMHEYAKKAVEAEREACAKEVENYALGYAEPVWAFKVASIIRERGNR